MVLSEKSKRIIKEHIPENKKLKNISEFFSVFADRTRIKILTALSISHMSVSDISEILGMNQSTISHQLKTLRSADIVQTEREGKVVVYSISCGISDILEQGYSLKVT